MLLLRSINGDKTTLTTHELIYVNKRYNIYKVKTQR